MGWKHLLAATELVRVQCAGCGAPQDIGVSLVQAPHAPPLSREDKTPWSPGAVAAYHAALRDRLMQACPACHGSLALATVRAATGGTTLPEHKFDDELAVKVIAWTQRLTLECPECATEVQI
jgi:endogenous inhibitor of DNA gyrase (YacG/DUF329 family)